MTRDETKEIIKRIAAFYPRFEVGTATVDAWFERLKYVDYNEALGNLNKYVDNDTVNRAPTLAHITSRGPSGGAFINWEYRKEMQLIKKDESTYVDQNNCLWAYPEKD